ncbi:ABC transporter permease [Labrys wisconsinensis]|uniref:ABC transporter permease n=1 Tax=Labrys wisconsinensis TaxID=425677 RepID=UPI0027D834BA|nr:ABC transporter permease [Labrys wisconsinensis]
MLSRLDKVGAVIAILAAAGLVLEPFATVKANRIVSGRGVGLFEALPPAVAAAGLAVLVAGLLVALRRGRPGIRLAAGAIALATLGVLIGLVPGHLVPPGNALARVSPAAGFWVLGFAFAILVTDAIAKLALGPAARLAVLAAAAAGLAVLLGSGLWDGLSVMREYASHADSFWQEGGRHVALAFGSLVAAVAVGLPLGIACHRSPSLRGVTLPVLNIIQTIPSIAMYGLMMVPLGLLAASVPLAADLGIRGIGTAPALIALFLYSLLPVVANVVVGLGQTPPEVVEAAEGMGMTGRQRLLGVELPLALPVILTGIRIVLVQNIGLVTIAALIGGGGFGTFVFQGIGQAATDLVLLGAVPTIALAFTAAIILDALIEILRGHRP